MSKIIPPIFLFALFFHFSCTAQDATRPEASYLTASPAEQMHQAAKAFLSSLSDKQKEKAILTFEDERRVVWTYLPKENPIKGIPLKALNAAQQKAAMALVESGLSQQGYLKATAIMALEKILKEIDGRDVRDPELYFFTIHGTPSLEKTWAWSVEGHHLSLNFTIIEGKMIAPAPRFFGTNPAQVKHGSQKGLRVLHKEEDLGRALLLSLDEEQQKQAIFQTKAFPEILTRSEAKVSPLESVGISYNDLSTPQKDIFQQLLSEYLNNMPKRLAEKRLKEIKTSGMDKLTFGWAGGVNRGEGHYYRIQGPTFLIEFDNTQNNNNHAHSVWRDFDGDFGRDLLKEHYQKNH